MTYDLQFGYNIVKIHIKAYKYVTLNSEVN